MDSLAGLDDVRIKLARAEADIAAGRVDEVNTSAERQALLDGIKARSRSARDVMEQGKVRQ